MKKNDKNTIGILIGIVCFYFGFKYMDYFTVYIPNYIYIFLVILIASLISGIIISQIPNKTKREKKIIAPQDNKKIKTRSMPHNRQLDDATIKSLPLGKMSWREFERLCFLYYQAKGYKPIETKNGADGGVDLIITDPQYHEKVAIQIKHYINSKRQITVREIRELDSAKKNHNCILTEFITSTTFTNKALLQAQDRRMVTHDINWVRNKIDNWRKQQLNNIK